MKTLALLAFALPLGAVTITDTLTLADGSLANGRMVIALTTGTSSSSTTFAATRKTITITNGAVSVSLAANTSLTPAGTLYRVEYFLRSNGGDSVEYWNIPTGGPFTIREVRWRPRAPTGYEASFTGATWTVPASVHGMRTTGLTIDCSDASGNELECAVNVNPINYLITASFANSQAGRLVVNAIAAWSTQNYVKSITSQTAVSIPYSEHLMATSRLQAECYDTSGNQVTCEYAVNSSNYTVSVSFAIAQSGWIVVSGR